MINNRKLSNYTIKEKNLYGVGYMTASAILFALVPIFLTWGEAYIAPFAYNTVRTIFTMIATLLFLFAFYKDELLDRATWKAVGMNLRKWSLLGITFGYFNYLTFSLSLKCIDVSVATVLFETWPIWMILLTGIMFKIEKRYENVSASGWVFVLMGFSGLVFVILSQNTDIFTTKNSVSLFDIFCGVSLVLLASLMGAMVGSCSIRWGATALKDVCESKRNKTNKDLTMLFTLIGMIIAGIPSITISTTLAVLERHNEIVELNNMIIAAILGFFVVNTALILFRVANFITTKLEINAICYSTPILSLVCLAIVGYINVSHIDWLVIGTIGVVAANILLNLKAVIKRTHKYWVFALWVVGVISYFYLNKYIL